jgi:hypothetical protein
MDSQTVVLKVHEPAVPFKAPTSMWAISRQNWVWIAMIPFLAIMVINTMWYNTMTDYLPWNQKYSWLLLLHVWTVTVSIGLSLFQMMGPTYGWLRKHRLYGISLHRWNGILIYTLMIIGLLSGAALARVQRYFQFNNVWYLDITDLNLLLIPSVGGYMT